jgi:hypothetical protein
MLNKTSDADSDNKISANIELVSGKIINTNCFI